MGLEQIWAQKAEVDLFAAKRNTHCPPWFFLAPHDDPSLEVDALVHMPWPTKLFFCFSITWSHSSFAGGNEAEAVIGHSGGPQSLIGVVVCRDYLDVGISMALFSGVIVKDTCTAALWSTS